MNIKLTQSLLVIMMPVLVLAQTPVSHLSTQSKFQERLAKPQFPIKLEVSDKETKKITNLPFKSDEKKSETTRFDLLRKSSGTNSGGGGNAVNYKMVESFAKSSEQFINNNKLVAQLFHRLHNGIPDFGAALQLSAENLTWFIIPGEISELPAEQTGLHFSSDQAAYQENEEIFVNEMQLNKMTEENVFRLYVHELMMERYLKIKKSDGSVTMANLRKVVVLLTKDTEISIIKLRDGIDKNGFGFYPVVNEYENIYQGFLLSIQKAKAICSQPFYTTSIGHSPYRDSIHDIAQAFGNPDYENEITFYGEFGGQPSFRATTFYSVIIQEPFIKILALIFNKFGSDNDALVVKNYRAQNGLSIPQNRNEKFEQVCKKIKEQ